MTRDTPKTTTTTTTAKTISASSAKTTSITTTRPDRCIGRAPSGRPTRPGVRPDWRCRGQRSVGALARRQRPCRHRRRLGSC